VLSQQWVQITITAYQNNGIIFCDQESISEDEKIISQITMRTTYSAE
jgi:hypothetical protein